MGNKSDLIIQEAERLGKLCIPYAGEGNGGIGCSRFVKLCLHAAGMITKAELDNDYSMWAGQGIAGFLEDSSRFEKLQWSAALKLKKADVLFSLWNHTALFDGAKGLHEACPKGHGLSTNGMTGVGHFPNHGTYNCGNGTNSWTCVYRVKDIDRDEIIEKAIKEAEKIADDNSIGYCNEYPYNTGARGYDCGAFLSKAWELAGIFPKGSYYEPLGSGGNYNLYNEKLLTDHGFSKNRYSSVKSLKRGDIVISGGHTVMFLGSVENNKIIHARKNYDGRIGDSSGKEICKTDWYENNWCYYFRYGEESTPSTVLTYGSTGTLVKTLQQKLNEKLGVGLVIDGSFGPATLEAVKQYQARNGLEVDGSVGPLTWASLYQEIIPAPIVDYKEILKAADAVFNGEYGNNPERKEKLTAKYGARVADKIQQIVDIAGTN